MLKDLSRKAFAAAVRNLRKDNLFARYYRELCPAERARNTRAWTHSA